MTDAARGNGSDSARRNATVLVIVAFGPMLWGLYD